MLCFLHKSQFFSVFALFSVGKTYSAYKNEKDNIYGIIIGNVLTDTQQELNIISSNGDEFDTITWSLPFTGSMDTIRTPHQANQVLANPLSCDNSIIGHFCIAYCYPGFYTNNILSPLKIFATSKDDIVQKICLPVTTHCSGEHDVAATMSSADPGFTEGLALSIL